MYREIARIIVLSQQPKSSQENLSEIPPFLSTDGKSRPLIFSKVIANKIDVDHPGFSPENLVINANDWEYVALNVQGNPDKINLIKPTSGEGFIRIGAEKQNGYFIVTHYENVAGRSQPLKNLLAKGDFLDRSGRTLGSSSATSPEGAAGQLEGNISGVRTDNKRLPQNNSDARGSYSPTTYRPI